VEEKRQKEKEKYNKKTSKSQPIEEHGDDYSDNENYDDDISAFENEGLDVVKNNSAAENGFSPEENDFSAAETIQIREDKIRQDKTRLDQRKKEEAPFSFFEKPEPEKPPEPEAPPSPMASKPPEPVIPPPPVIPKPPDNQQAGNWWQRPRIKPDQAKSAVVDGATWFDAGREVWNSTDPLQNWKRVSIDLSMPQRDEYLNAYKVFPDVSEFIKAIQNYAFVLRNPKDFDTRGSRYDSYLGFIKLGLGKYCDDAKPFENFRRPKSEAELEDEASRALIAKRVAEAEARKAKVKNAPG
jgi:hypothetical protein